MRKIFLLLFSVTLLSSCAQSTALLGPAITAGNTGSVMQASFSYGSNMALKSVTGKTPGEHAASFISERKEKKRIRKEIVSYLETHIEDMRKKLSLKK